MKGHLRLDMDFKKQTIEEHEKELDDVLRRENNFITMNFDLLSRKVGEVMQVHMETERLLKEMDQKLSNL